MGINCDVETNGNTPYSAYVCRFYPTGASIAYTMCQFSHYHQTNN